MLIMHAADSHVLAFIDIGSNAIRLMVVRFHANRTFKILRQEREAVRLGANAFTRHILLPAEIKRAIAACRKLKIIALALGATEIDILATAAIRETANREEIVRLLREQAQLGLRIISGREEARLIYLGALAYLPAGNQPALCLDIGGGSTELIVGNRQACRYLNTIPLGAVRLTALFLQRRIEEPVTAPIYRQMRQYVRETMEQPLKILRLYPIQRAIGCSGAIVSIGEFVQRISHDRDKQRNGLITLGQLRRAIMRLRSLPLSERKKLPSIQADRADIIIAGGVILETILQDLKLGAIQFTRTSLRHGLIIDRLMQH